jgi:hypothetical protein
LHASNAIFGHLHRLKTAKKRRNDWAALVDKSESVADVRRRDKRLMMRASRRIALSA